MATASQVRLREIMNAFHRWATATGEPVDVDVTEAILRFRTDFADAPDPCAWHEGDISELLLRVLPAHALIEDLPRGASLPAVRAYLRFLHASNLLRRGSAPLPRLLHELDSAGHHYEAAMTDPARAGLAKRVVTGMRQAGVDLADEAAVERWMAEFNALPVSERMRVVGGVPGLPFDEEVDEPPPQAGPSLPVVRLTPPTELAAAARRSVLLRQAWALAEWAAGRQLTSTGVLRLADARAAVAELSIPLGPADTARLATLRSARELVPLERLWAICEVAGLIDRGRTALPGPSLRALSSDADDDVLRVWTQVLFAVIELGLVQSGRTRLALVWDEFVEEHLPRLMAELYAGSPEIKMADVVEWLSEEFAKTHPGLDVRQIETSKKVIGENLRKMIGSLTDHGTLSRTNGGIQLTPLGLFGLREWFLSQGVDAPAIGEPAEFGAAELLDAADSLADSGRANQLFQDWLAARAPEAAAEELLRVASQRGALDRSLLFALLGNVGPVAEPVVRRALDNRVLRPYAAAWLEDRGLEAPQLVQEEVEWLLVDFLSGLLEEDALAGPGIEHLSELGMPAEQVDIVEQLWRVDHPDTVAVLESIGRTHPDKGVAKAARKASFKARSRR